MGHAHEALEHSEHIAHAGHGHALGDRLSTHIGITIAVLGVFLAVAGAKVGAERTELVGTMVEQEHAHAEFQMQNIKHRMTVLVLRQVHADIPASRPAALISAFDGELNTIEAESGKRPETAAAATAAVESIRDLGHTMIQRSIPQKDDTVMLARLVDRYFAEQESAQKWVDAYDPAVKAHSEAQERYEWGQLSAEFGVVVCSLALLFRSRTIWIASIVLGLISLGAVIVTYQHTVREVTKAEGIIEELRKDYEEKHLAGKTRKFDKAMVDEVIEYYGGKPDKPAEKGGDQKGSDKKGTEHKGTAAESTEKSPGEDK